MVLWIKYLDRVIRAEANHVSALRDGEVSQPVGGQAVLGVLLGVVYGLCMGCFGLFQRGSAALMQLVATMLKVPALFFLTLAVTLPSLYVFNAIVGSRISLQSVVRDMRHRFMLTLWAFTYSFVGIQMGWVLRPFVGEPGKPVQFFRADAWGNAYVVVAGLAAHMFRR